MVAPPPQKQLQATLDATGINHQQKSSLEKRESRRQTRTITSFFSSSRGHLNLRAQDPATNAHPTAHEEPRFQKRPPLRVVVSGANKYYKHQVKG